MTNPGTSLLALALAAHERAQTDAELDKETRRQASAYSQYQAGLRLLSRLIPAILAQPFDPDRAELLQLHHEGFTAQVEVEGYRFRPCQTRREASGMESTLSEERVTALEVCIKATPAMMRHSDIVWMRVASLEDLGAALGTEQAGHWGGNRSGH